MKSLIALLAHPVIAASLGVAVGASLLVLTRSGVRFITPENPEIGVVRAVVLMISGLVLGFVALLLYFLFVRAGLAAFGIGLVAGFLIPAFVALFVLSGVVRTSS
ncbi:MAG: hypothetical protein ACYC6C_04160 [Coriobacteriia bacterium]